MRFPVPSHCISPWLGRCLGSGQPQQGAVGQEPVWGRVCAEPTPCPAAPSPAPGSGCDHDGRHSPSPSRSWGTPCTWGSAPSVRSPGTCSTRAERLYKAGEGPAYPNFSPVYFCLSSGQLVPVGVNLIAIFLPASLRLCVRPLVVQGNYMGEVDTAKKSLVSIVGGAARSPSVRPGATASLRSSGSRQTVLLLSPSGTGMEGAGDAMEAAVAEAGISWSSPHAQGSCRPLSPCRT